MTLSKFLFFATAAVTTIFIITILAMVTMLAEDPRSPINVWFNKHGAVVMTVEVVAIGVFGMAAMIADRNETVKKSTQRNTDPKA